MKHPFDDLVLQGMDCEADPSGVDPTELLCFACREAYYHLRSRAPDIPEDDPIAGRARPASFVAIALLMALDHAGHPLNIKTGEAV